MELSSICLYFQIKNVYLFIRSVHLYIRHNTDKNDEKYWNCLYFHILQDVCNDIFNDFTSCSRHVQNHSLDRILHN